MDTRLSLVKRQIMELYKKRTHLHVSMAMNYSRINPKRFTAEITGVYPNLFSVETLSGEKKEKHILQYVDLLTGNIDIAEMKKQKKHSKKAVGYKFSGSFFDSAFTF